MRRLFGVGDDERVSEPRLQWPATEPAWGRVRLRAFSEADVAMVRELATDPYLALIGSLPPHADTAGALAWIERQRGRLAEGAGFSFCIADQHDVALGTAGLWTGGLADGRATVGYALCPSERGLGIGGRRRDMCRYAALREDRGRRRSEPP